MGKPDCERCGFPYRAHNVGTMVYCPIIATYRPKAEVEAAPPHPYEGVDGKTLFAIGMLGGRIA